MKILTILVNIILNVIILSMFILQFKLFLFCVHELLKIKFIDIEERVSPFEESINVFHLSLGNFLRQLDLEFLNNEEDNSDIFNGKYL